LRALALTDSVYAKPLVDLVGTRQAALAAYAGLREPA